MRINIYAEELTSEIEIVTKTVNDDKFGERTFYGFRIFLVSPDVLHHSKKDDDRSAITFWVKWTKDKGNDFSVIEELLDNLNGAVGGIL